MKKRVQFKDIKANQIITDLAAKKLKGGGEAEEATVETADIIVEDTLIM